MADIVWHPIANFVPKHQTQYLVRMAKMSSKAKIVYQAKTWVWVCLCLKYQGNYSLYLFPQPDDKVSSFEWNGEFWVMTDEFFRAGFDGVLTHFAVINEPEA